MAPKGVPGWGGALFCVPELKVVAEKQVTEVVPAAPDHLAREAIRGEKAAVLLIRSAPSPWAAGWAGTHQTLKVATSLLTRGRGVQAATDSRRSPSLLPAYAV